MKSQCRNNPLSLQVHGHSGRGIGAHDGPFPSLAKLRVTEDDLVLARHDRQIPERRLAVGSAVDPYAAQGVALMLRVPFGTVTESGVICPGLTSTSRRTR